MIIESIELQHVGPFRGTVIIGPLKTGINVLAAPNETGKSTFLRAAARALFDKHTCKDDEILSLQPAGSDLAPQIIVVFEHCGKRYRVQKRFLNNPESWFSEWNGKDWQLQADGNSADERIQKLLQSTVPGRGATKAAHWGMLAFLWARQGENCEWPSWEGEAGQFIQTRLARVEIDPVIDRLRASLWENYAEIFTNTGKAKTRGPLEQLETELQKLESDKQQLKEQRSALEILQRQFSDLGPRLVTLQEEAATREREARESRELAAAAEVLLVELRQRQSEFDAAREKLETVTSDIGKLSEHNEALKAAKADLITATDELNRAIEAEKAAKDLCKIGQQELDAAAARLQQLSDEKDRASKLLKLKTADAELATVKKVAKKAAAHEQKVCDLRAQLQKLPNITPAKLKKFQELNQSIRELESKLEVTGLTVELNPDSASKVTVTRKNETEKLALKSGASETLHAPQHMELHLIGWGRVQIRSGAAELATMQEELTQHRESLREQLSSADCATLADAETAVTRRRDVQKELQVAEEKLAESLDEFDSLEELATKAAALERQASILRETISPTSAEVKASAAQLEADAERLGVSFKKEQETQTVLTRELKKRRDTAEQCAETRQKAETEKVTLTKDITSLDQQISTLQGRYLVGLDEAKRAAQRAFVAAEARRDETKGKLPPDAAKLPERNRRAAAAFEQVRCDLESRKRDFDNLEGALQNRGADGLYSKLALLEEREAVVRQQLDHLRARGWSARLAHDLIVFRKQAATRSVLGPIEARLSGAFGEISRDTQRHVFLDEHLQISGIGTTRESMISFSHLSQGAKEQLLLCLRLAVAGEVASSGHRLVVLDDVLVNTDAQRQQRVLDLLQTSATQLQILILTCHPENYRGIGNVVEIRTA